MIEKVIFWEGKFNFPKCRMYIFFRMSFIVQNLINISQSITYWSRRLMEFDTFERRIPQLMNVKNFSKSCRFECFYFLSGMSVFNFRMWIPHGYHRNTSKKGQGPEIYVRKECIEIFVLFNFFSDLNITLETIVRYTFSQMKNRPFNVKLLCHRSIDRNKIHTNISRIYDQL